MDNNYLDQVQTDLKAYVKTQMTIGKLQLVGGISRILGIFLLALTIMALYIWFCNVKSIYTIVYIV